MYSVIPLQVRLAVLALFISHGISFIQNYLLKREYATARPDKLMGSPYGRVIVMHIAILAGGFLTMTIGSPAPLLVVLVILKTILDVSLHKRAHKKAAVEVQNK
jgi:purine-cytosine permease-like protein